MNISDGLIKEIIKDNGNMANKMGKKLREKRREV